MATYTGTAGNDAWTLVRGGTFSLDGLGGVDKLYMGTSARSSYAITQGSDGSIQVDTLSGASQAAHITLYNVEVLVFNNGRDPLDLTTAFGDHTAPSVSLGDDTVGIAHSDVTYSLAFSEPVTGLDASDFTVDHGQVSSVSGSGSLYSVRVAPQSGYEGGLALSLHAGAVADAAGNVNTAVAAAPQPVDTLAPSLVSSLPAAHASNVALGSTLSLSFSEPVLLGTAGIVLRSASGPVVMQVDAAHVTGASVSGQTLTLTPTTEWALGASYELSLINGSVTDLSGNALGAASTIAFSTTSDVSARGGLGTSLDDHISASPGTTQVDGGAGTDTVQFVGLRAAYTVQDASGSTVVSAHDGRSATTLVQVERLQFTDIGLALDLSGVAGLVAKTLGAVFGVAAVSNAAYAGIGLSLADAGLSAEALMALALDARLGAGATSGQVVDLLYTNVIGHAPSSADHDAYVALIDSHAYNAASLGLMAADSAFNTAHIDLVGLARSGLAFTLPG